MSTNTDRRHDARHYIEAKRYTGTNYGLHYDSAPALSCSETMRNVAWLLRKHVPRIEAEYASLNQTYAPGALRLKRQRLDPVFIGYIIDALKKGDMNQAEIAQKFQVCSQTVGMIKRRIGPYKNIP